METCRQTLDFGVSGLGRWKLTTSILGFRVSALGRWKLTALTHRITACPCLTHASVCVRTHKYRRKYTETHRRTDRERVRRRTPADIDRYADTDTDRTGHGGKSGVVCVSVCVRARVFVSVDACVYECLAAWKDRGRIAPHGGGGDFAH